MLSKTYLLLLALMCVGMAIAMPKAPFRGDGVMMPVAGMHRVKRGPPAQTVPGGPVASDEEAEPGAKKSTDGMNQLVVNDKAKEELRVVVKGVVSLVDTLRNHGSVFLPDPVERLFKSIIESLEKLQDELNADLDIDMGNLLNSGGK